MLKFKKNTFTELQIGFSINYQQETSHKTRAFFNACLEHKINMVIQ